jgi:hypothetical protein
MPVTGESYLRQLTSSVPLSLFAQISHSRPYPEFAYTMLISSVNDIRNPSFLFGSQQDDPRFNRFVAIMTELTQEQRLHWVADSQQRERFDLVIDPASQQNKDRTDELLELLGLSGLEQRGKRLIIPVSPALSGAKSGGIGITTRTIWELVEILSAAVQVPADDEKSGIAAAFPRPGEAGRALRVHYASSSPERAYVAVEYRNGWFYIDSADQATKRYFKLLGGLWSAVMAESLGATSAPVLTVPVSR